MLIQFEVENFRSIKDLVVLQTSAINYYKELESSVIKPNLPGLKNVDFLKTIAIFGANASGKSNIFRALGIFRSIIMSPAFNDVSAELPYEPFKLNKDTIKEPTHFGIAFVAEGIRYEYEMAYKKSEIVFETLACYPKGYKQVWFTRSADHIKDSTYIRVPKALRPLVNPATPILSLLANYPGFPESEKIRPVYRWFAESLVLVDRSLNSVSDDELPFSGEILDEKTGSDFQRDFIRHMIKHADVGILDAHIEREIMPDEDFAMMKNLIDSFSKNPGLEQIASQMPSLQDRPEVKRVVFEHAAMDGDEHHFEMSDESDGTINLFCLSGRIADSLERGATLFVDELDRSLHPRLIKELIRCFQDASVNKKNAQLIFTAHNPCILSNGLLRRDQVWRTEKKRDGSTELLPISEFSPRQNESIEAGYIIGRYGGTPFVPDCFGLC